MNDFPKMSPVQTAVFAWLRRNGTISAGQKVDGRAVTRRTVEALVRHNLATWTDRGDNWAADLAAPGLAIKETPAAEQAPAIAPAGEEEAPADAPQPLDLEVIYTGMGDPIVHAAGCQHTDRGEAIGPEQMTAATLEDVAARVYADVIDEGTPASDLVQAFIVKPCAQHIRVYRPATPPAPLALLDPVAEFADAVAANEVPAAAPRPRRLLPNEARAVVNETLPNALDFEPVFLADGTYMGYTYQDGEEYGALNANGWALAGPYPQRAAAVSALTYGAQVTAATKAFPDAHTFWPAHDEHGRQTGSTFRTGHGATAVYTYVTLDAQTDPHVQCVYRTAAERTLAQLHPLTAPLAAPAPSGAPTAAGSLPKHADDHLVRTALDAIGDGLARAELSDEGHEEGDAYGVMVEPRDAGRIAAYWVCDRRVAEQGGKPFTAQLDALAERLAAAGWTVEMRDASTPCVFATAPDAVTLVQARAAVEFVWPNANAFVAEYDDAGVFLGFTFATERRPNTRYGWVTAALQYAKGAEPYRSEAAAMLPVQRLDDERTAARQAARTSAADAARPARVTARVDVEETPAQDAAQDEPAPPAVVGYDVPAPINPPSYITPFHGPAGWDGLVGICGWDDHRAPLDADGRIGVHHRDPEAWPLLCKGSLKAARQNLDEPTQQDTAHVDVDAPRQMFPIHQARRGDRVRPLPGGDIVTVMDVQPHQYSDQWVFVATAEVFPFTLPCSEQVIHESRVRAHDVPCKLCGVVVVAEADEAADGRPRTRVCGLCEHRATQTTA